MAATPNVVAMPASERSARNTLLFGAVLLALGLGLVGVGADGAGAVPVVAGLFLTVFAIHNYGRLGPVEDGPASAGAEEDAVDVAALASVAGDKIWQGALLLLAGLAVTISTYLDAKQRGGGSIVLAYGAILGGLARITAGRVAQRDAKRIKAKVEKRRRMDKSRAP